MELIECYMSEPKPHPAGIFYRLLRNIRSFECKISVLLYRRGEHEVATSDSAETVFVSWPTPERAKMDKSHIGEILKDITTPDQGAA